jgi:Fe2+ or Zn2+ uptake regulation protein
LADHGYRATEPRRQVLAAVLEQDRPFTAEQIVAMLPAIGRATVYRTLEILAGIDLCKNCGFVIEFTTCPIDDLVAHLTRDTSFEIESHHLEIVGLCPQCQSLQVDSALN